jgi:hypothetical protein
VLGRSLSVAKAIARVNDINAGLLICIFQSSYPFRNICRVMASAIYKRWIAGCSVPSNPTIAKIANPRAISIALLRVS